MIYIERAEYFIPSEEQPLPDVKFVPMLTRRRLSQLSKMVVYVNAAISKDQSPCKVTFASQYGEISQQLKISQALLDTGNVSPAHFSLSVFNASIANDSRKEYRRLFGRILREGCFPRRPKGLRRRP